MTWVALSRQAARQAAFWLLCVAALATAPAAGAQQAGEPTTRIDPPGRVARLSLIEGEVSFAPAGTDEWSEAVLNRPVTSEDRLWLGADARAELQIGSATVHLDRETGFGFIRLDDNVMQMSLTEGAATIRVRRLAESETIQVETPNATVRLRHTGEYHFEVDPETDRTMVKTRSGEAEVAGGGESYIVRANEQGQFTGLDDLSAQVGPIAARTPFEAWANDRDRDVEQSESARYVSRDVVGYSDLDEHGDWTHERDYGYVWQPRHVSAGWAPYRFGRWAWVSPWGWTWIDDARWGFAPFHYGRWAYLRHRHRWCWVPGPRHLRPVYAPALVGWIGGPSVSVSVSFGHGVGWFPLGPREIYVPGYRHTPRYIRHVNVSNTVIVNNTHITNVYTRRSRHHEDYRHRHHAHAVTAVLRDRFVSGRPIGGHRVRLDESDLRQWRDNPRAPAITPTRASVRAAPPRELRSARIEGRTRDWLTHRDGRPARIGFESERRAIEANGGRPIARSQLVENPKERRGDYRVTRPGSSGDVKHRQGGRQLGLRPQNERSGAAPSIVRPTPQGDVRRSERSDGRQRLEIMRGESEARSFDNRREAVQGRSSGERARSFNSRRPQAVQERSFSQPAREAPPRREVSPSPQRHISPAPTSRAREHTSRPREQAAPPKRAPQQERSHRSSSRGSSRSLDKR